MSVSAAPRTFWWDAGRPADAAVDPLSAVVFDLDALAEDAEDSVSGADVTARAGLDDLVNSLYFAGIPIAVVSTGDQPRVAPLVRQLLGDGIVDTIVTPGDLTSTGRTPPDLHGHALWELGLAPEQALAVTGTTRGLRATRMAKLATLVVTTGSSDGADFGGAAQVRRSYDGLLVCDVVALHRRWWAGR